MFLGNFFGSLVSIIVKKKLLLYLFMKVPALKNKNKTKNLRDQTVHLCSNMRISMDANGTNASYSTGCKQNWCNMLYKFFEFQVIWWIFYTNIWQPIDCLWHIWCHRLSIHKQQLHNEVRELGHTYFTFQNKINLQQWEQTHTHFLSVSYAKYGFSSLYIWLFLHT